MFAACYLKKEIFDTGHPKINLILIIIITDANYKKWMFFKRQ